MDLPETTTTMKLTECTGDLNQTKISGDMKLIESTGDMNLTETTGGMNPTESTGDIETMEEKNVPETTEDVNLTESINEEDIKLPIHFIKVEPGLFDDYDDANAELATYKEETSQEETTDNNQVVNTEEFPVMIKTEVDIDFEDYFEHKELQMLNSDDKEETTELFVPLKRCCKCEYCFESFKTNTSLYKHKCTKFLKCHLCGAKIQQYKTMKHHILNHGGTMSYSCGLCSETFSWLYNLEIHIKTHETVYKPYMCCLCNSRFVSVSILQRHTILVHEYELRAGKLSNLGSDTMTENDGSSKFRRTVRKLLANGKDSFKCSACNKEFQNYLIYSWHLRMCNELGPSSDDKECKDC